MNNKEHKLLLDKMRKVAMDVSGNSALAKKVLRQTGVYTSSGVVNG